MNVCDAAYATVHDYPGGSESLGPRVGISCAVLRNKVNPNNPGNHLTLQEADRIMSVTGDKRILMALAAEHGFVLDSIEAPDQGGSIMNSLLELGAVEGEFARTLHDALADGKITPNEMDAIAAAGAADQRALIGLIARLRHSVERPVGA